MLQDINTTTLIESTTVVSKYCHRETKKIVEQQANRERWHGTTSDSNLSRKTTSSAPNTFLALFCCMYCAVRYMIFFEIVVRKCIALTFIPSMQSTMSCFGIVPSGFLPCWTLLARVCAGWSCLLNTLSLFQTSIPLTKFRPFVCLSFLSNSCSNTCLE